MADPETHKRSQRAALEIYQALLDKLNVALMTNDEAVLMDGMSYPFRVSTLQEEFIIESAADWLACTARFLQNLKAQGVNNYIRLATGAEFLSENYVAGSHITYTMRNANFVVPPYESRATLVRTDGVWRFIEMDSAIQNNRWPISTVLPDKTKQDGGSHQRPKARPQHDAQDDVRRTPLSPTTIYQEFLDELSEINMAGDFDAWCEKCEFPHSVHIERVDEIIAGPKEIRPFLEMISAQIERHDIDEINRKASHAEFISATQICGYHTTTFTSGGQVKLGPVSGRYILNRTGTSWRMASVTNSISNAEFPYAQPEPGDALVSLREIQERTLKT